jgi:hypothetical protein
MQQDMQHSTHECYIYAADGDVATVMALAKPLFGAAASFL